MADANSNLERWTREVANVLTEECPDHLKWHAKMRFDTPVKCIATAIREAGADDSVCYELMAAFEYDQPCESLLVKLRTIVLRMQNQAGAKPRVRLSGQQVWVDEKPKTLTDPQSNVIQALLEAGPDGLTKDELVNDSGHSDARGILDRLAKGDADWKSVIQFAGKTGGGYRIR